MKNDKKPMFDKKINHFKTFLMLTGVVFLSALLIQCSALKIETYYENAAVATANPIASSIAVDIFKLGGNAFDAAVGVGFVLAVVHPEAGNIGGGGFAVVREGATRKIETLDFREIAPKAATENMFLDNNGVVIDQLSTHGAKAVGVPGTVAGLHALWEKYGALEWSDLVTYAAALADTGFIVDSYLAASLTEYNDQFTSFPQTDSTFSPEGQSLLAGDRLSQPLLAKALYIIAAEGPSGFYSGTIADSLVATMQEYGGLITHEDLLMYDIQWREPVSFTFDSLEIYSMPPPSSGGIIVGQILKLIEPFDFSKYTVNSTEYINLFAETAKLAFADRSEHLGDPAFYSIPRDKLLSKPYLDSRREQISIKNAVASESIVPGLTPVPESEQTTHFSIADKNGNIVSLTYTLNTSYGSKVMVNGFGVLLNNEMDDFSIKPGVQNSYGLIGGEANKIEPGKRMLSSMSPTIILKDDKPFLVIGSPGGSKIISTVAQSVIAFSRFGLSTKETVAQPRFHHQWIPDILYLEEGTFTPQQIEKLTSYGYTIKERSPYSDVQMIFIDETGFMTGASDPRNNGTVAGY